MQKTNEVTQVLANTTPAEYAAANATASHFRGWKKGETYAINGVILHELYFQNLGDAPGDNTPPVTMGPATQQLIQRFFGSTEKWQQDFTATATAARGWCLWVYEQRTNTCRNILLDTHDLGNIATAYPLLVLDMYEHAYFLDYGTNKAAYIARFLQEVNWPAVEQRAQVVAGKV